MPTLFLRGMMAAALIGCAALPAGAQLPNASTSALGLGQNFTAAARGYGAMAWNPALLAARSNNAASMTLLTGAAGAGLGPIELSDLSNYADELVPEPVKTEWLARVGPDGAERGTADADATWAAAQIGRFGVQVSSSVRTLADLSHDVLQLFLFGNVDDSGNPATLDFAGSRLDIAVYSTAALGYAQPLQLAPATRLLVGVTGKYTLGHVLLTSDESVGAAGAGGFDLAFPIINTSIDPDSIELNNGQGFGLDVGVALELGAWTLGASMQNVMNTFEWDSESLRYRPFTLEAREGELVADTEEDTFANAPADLRAQVEELGFEPAFALGAAFEPSQRLLLSADFRSTGDDGMRAGATSHLGAGMQYKVTSWLPVRVGGALVSHGEDNNGFQFGGGVGINMGGWNLAASALQRDTERFGGETLFMATIFATGLP